jgi:hypothetical protein
MQPASFPGTSNAAPKPTNYLPLVLILGGLLVVAIILVVFFALRH